MTTPEAAYGISGQHSTTMDHTKFASLSVLEAEDDQDGYENAYDPLIASSGPKRTKQSHAGQPGSWASIALALFAITSALVLHLSLPKKAQTIYSTASLGSLRSPNPYPNLEEEYNRLQASKKGECSVVCTWIYSNYRCHSTQTYISR